VDSDAIVGRDTELSRVRALLAGAAAGVGAAVLVEGEQGIGKSTLLRAGLAGAAAAGCQVCWAAADELEQLFPLRLISLCLGTPELAGLSSDPAGVSATAGDRPAASPRGLAGPMPAGDPVLADMERLLARVDQMCSRAPLVLVTEDLHWADEASVLAWYRLSRAVVQMPLLLAGSMRPVPSREDLARLRRGLRARGGDVLVLGPLGAAAVRDMTAGLVGGRPGPRLARLAERAGGNPFYVRELVESLHRAGRVRVGGRVAELTGQDETRIPVSVLAAARDRMSSLPEEVVTVLRWAAVLGQEFSVTDLEVVTGRTAGNLMRVVDEAMTAGAIADAPVGVRDEPRLGFRHPLLRQALYEEMPAAMRRALHRQAARELAAAGAPAEKVAAQLVAAPGGADEWLVAWLAEAMPALIYQAPRLASELLRGALGEIGLADPRREALESCLVTMAFALLRDEEVKRVAPSVLARAKDPDRIMELSWLLAYSLTRSGQPAQAAEAAYQALSLPQASEVWRARLHAVRSLALILTGHRDDAEQVAARALGIAQATGDSFALGYALHTLSLVSERKGDEEGKLEHISRALKEISEDSRASDLRLLLLGNQIEGLRRLDRHAEALDAIRTAMTLAERTGTPRLSVVCLSAAEYSYELGHWDDALAVLEPVAVLPGPHEAPIGLHGIAALITGHRGDHVTAAEHLAAVPADAIRTEAVRVNAHHLLLASALLAERRGQPGDAVSILAPVLDPGSADMPERHWVLPVLTRLALAVGDRATASAAADVAGDGEIPAAQAAARYCRGLVAGDPALVLAAAGYYESTGRPLYLAQAQEDAAVLLASLGDRDRALASFAVALRGYRELGAQWDITRADARLRDHGVAPSGVIQPARPATGWDALTAIEVEIARLIADGRPNPEIAAKLDLPRHAVQTHASHILAKLGARSRAEIGLRRS